MKKLVLVLFLLGLVSQPTFAQNGPKSVDETAKIADLLYQELGPERGAVFYEPHQVLVLSGRIPRATIEVPAGLQDYEGLTERLTTYGLLLIRGEETVTLVSVDGLRSRFSDELPKGVEPWTEDKTVSDFKAWDQANREQLEAIHGESSFGIYYGLMKGLPLEAISARMKGRADPVLAETTVFARVPYSDFLAGDDLEFRVFSTAANDLSSVNWSQERGAYLQNFYTQKEIKSRIDSPEFLLSRSEDTSYKSKSSPRERWLEGRPYGSFELEPYRVYIHHERVLAENFSELAKRAKANESPYRWIGFLNSKLNSEELIAPFNRSVLRKMIWSGAYPCSPARQNLYNLVAEVRPEYLDAELKEKMKAWTEASEKKDRYFGSATLRLFKHPRFARYFTTLSADERAPFLQSLEALRDDKEIRLLLGKPPYNGE